MHSPRRCCPVQQCSRRALPWGEPAQSPPATQPSHPVCPAALPSRTAHLPRCSAALHASQEDSGTPKAAELRPGGDRSLSLPVPGRWPIDGGGVSRLGTGPGSKCPCPCWQHLETPPGPRPGTAHLQQPRAGRRVVPGEVSVAFTYCLD